jgi:alpha-beta hydrolase superfamily lysophospholipase
MRIRWRDPEMSALKWAKALLVVGLTFLVVYLVANVVLQSYLLTHPMRWALDLTEEATGAPVERVSFQSTDGLLLAGWFVPGTGDGATIAISHGLGSNGPVSYAGYAFLHRAGYHLFVFDHRAHGQSEGRVSTQGAQEVRDMVGAVRYLQARPEVDPARIGAIGCSMGSAAVIGAAAEEPALRAVVAEAVYADLAEVWDRFGRVSVRGTSLSWSWGAPMRSVARLWVKEPIGAFRPEALIARIAPRAVMIVHGEQDNAACTVDDARRLYSAAAEPKSLWIVPGAGHCAAHASQPEAYEARVLAFFDGALARQGARAPAEAVLTQHLLGPALDPPFATCGDLVGWHACRVNRLPGKVEEDLGQRRVLVGGIDPHVERDVLLEGLAQHPVDKGARQHRPFGALEDAGELDLAKARARCGHGAGGRDLVLALAIVDLGGGAGRIADHDRAVAVAGCRELAIVRRRPPVLDPHVVLAQGTPVVPVAILAKAGDGC